MITLKAKVEAYVGTVDSADALDSFLTAGAKFILNLLPVSLLKRVSSINNFTTSFSLFGRRLLNVYSGGYEASEVPVGRKTQAADTTSIYAASAITPIFYSESGNIMVLPTGSTNTAEFIDYPEVNSANSYIPNFPTEFEQGVILYGALHQKIRETEIAIAFTAPTVPTAPSPPTISYTDASKGTYTEAVLGIDGVAPTYTISAVGLVYTNATSAITTNEDIELGNAQLSQLQVNLGEYQANLEDRKNKFESENIEYQKRIQYGIEQARLTQQRLLQEAEAETNLNLQNEIQTLAGKVQEYQSKLQLYGQQIQSYGAEVMKEVQRLQVLTAGYTSQIQILRNEFNTYLVSLGIGAQANGN